MWSDNDTFYLLQDLLRELPKKKSTDVYEFDAQTDDSSRVSAPFYSKSKQDKTRAQGSKASENENKVYLKGFPEHVVEVTLSRDEILKACLTPLSQAPVQHSSIKRKEPPVNKVNNTPITTCGQKKRSLQRIASLIMPSTWKRSASPKPSTSKGPACPKPSTSKRPASPKPSTSKRSGSPKPSSSKRSPSPKPVKSKKSAPMTTSQRLKTNYRNPLLQMSEDQQKNNAKLSIDTAQVVEAPTFHLTKEEFNVSTYRFNYAW